MVRIALSILIVLPLLCPPGMCLCQLGRTACVTVAESLQAQCDEADACGCGCRGHDAATPDRPARREHCPVCPALKFPVYWAAKPTGSLAVLALVPAGVVCDPAAGSFPSVDASPLPSPGGGETPLYLALRTLRI
jgi:hypothetical protein